MQLSQQRLPKQPPCSQGTILCSTPTMCSVTGAARGRRVPRQPLLPRPQPLCRVSQVQCSSLPKGFALCLMPDAHTALCNQNQHNLSIFFFKKYFPFPLGSSPAPTELREMGLVLICRHELIADELWQLFQEGVCKVISAIKPLWVGCDYFFLPSSFCT